MHAMIPAGEQNVGQPERILSACAGVLLALLALRRAPLALALAALGAGLLYRATTGSCPVYRSMGLSSAGAPVSLHASDAPKEEQVDETIEGSFPASDPPGWHTGSSFTQVSE